MASSNPALTDGPGLSKQVTKWKETGGKNRGVADTGWKEDYGGWRERGARMHYIHIQGCQRINIILKNNK